jgi:hypothetical protein
VCNLERAFLVQLFQFSNVLSTLSKVDWVVNQYVSVEYDLVREISSIVF